MPNSPNECRQHALHCLQVATGTKNISVRQTLLSVAATWRRLADALEDSEAAIGTSKNQPRKAA